VVLASGSGRSDYKYCLDEETRELKNRRILNVNWKIIFTLKQIVPPSANTILIKFGDKRDLAMQISARKM
jgi:hypothetical protein